jgi:hypothetical protein
MRRHSPSNYVLGIYSDFGVAPCGAHLECRLHEEPAISPTGSSSDVAEKS